MDIPGIPDAKMVEKCAKWKKVFGIMTRRTGAKDGAGRTSHGSAPDVGGRPAKADRE